MKQFSTLVLICACFIATPSAATDKVVQECAGNAEQSIVKMLTRLDETAKLLPKVPQAEAQFFEIQSAAFDKVRQEEYKSPNWAKPGVTDDDEKSRAIYETYAHRPFYKLWYFKKNYLNQFHSMIQNIIDPKSTWVVTFPDDRDAEQANRAVRLIDAANDYIRNVHQYLNDNENLKTDASDDAHFQMRTSAYALIQDLQHFLQCKIAKISERSRSSVSLRTK